MIPKAGGESWYGVDQALRRGRRGLPRASSLAHLLAKERGVRNQTSRCQLTLRHILAWADAHKRQTGSWPTAGSGPITAAPGETWQAVNASLHRGHRGLSGGTTLARLLAEERGKRNRKNLPRLTPQQIRAWAEAYRQPTGRWPTRRSGAIPEAPGETWSAVNAALMGGGRGLRGGSSLSRLLNSRRGSS